MKSSLCRFFEKFKFLLGIKDIREIKFKGGGWMNKLKLEIPINCSEEEYFSNLAKYVGQ